jgi:hypothetical protein
VGVVPGALPQEARPVRPGGRARAAKLAWGVLRKRFGSVITKKRLLAEAYAARAGRRSDRPADVTRAVAGAVVRALAGLFGA